MKIDIPHLEIPRIVVVGCGFAGLKFVKEIDSKNYQVVLLDRNNYHTFQPLMYQVATSGLEPDSIVYPIRKVFKEKKNFHFRIASVEGVNEKSREVFTDIGKIKYDFLVIATGAISNFFGLNNIEKHAYTMKSLVESLDLRSIVLQNFEKALNTSDLKERECLMNFVIVGGGATGVELAGALAELKRNILPKDYPDLDIRLMQIHIVEGADRVLANMSKKASIKSKMFLKELGVNLWLNSIVTDYDGSVAITNETNFNTRTLIWSAGVIGAPIGNDNIELTKDKRIIVDDLNKVVGNDKIYAI